MSDTNLPFNPGPIERTLQCSICAYSERVVFSPGDEHFSFTGDTIQATCPNCKTACAFHVITHTREPDLLTSAHEMFGIVHSKTTVNRRRHLRIRARGTKGCIKLADEEHMVEIVDYSKGGLKLLSPLLLASGTIIEVATDYVTGGMNIFKSARIVTMYRRPQRDFPGEYGVEFEKEP